VAKAARLIDPSLHDEVNLSTGERDGKILPAWPEYGIVHKGDVIEGPDELIGVAPYWRQPKDGDDLSFMETRTNELGEVTSVHDLGYGLLAQVGHWEHAEKGAE
jgi:hypothetical protein